jgi:hypothetical protein
MEVCKLCGGDHPHTGCAWFGTPLWALPLEEIASMDEQSQIVSAWSEAVRASGAQSALELAQSDPAWKGAPKMDVETEAITPTDPKGRKWPVRQRAGTRLSADAYPLYANGKTIGKFDPRNGVFQTGGVWGKNVWWPAQAFAVNVDVWHVITGKVRIYEFVDQATNTCHRCDLYAAEVSGTYGTTKRGERFLIPLECFEEVDQQGRLMERST